MKNLDSILPVSDEGLYPIRTVSEISGVNSITLRAWERRYDLFKPKRSAKGHRLYSEKDIQRIQEVLALLAKGVSIGRVAKVLKENYSESDLPDLLSDNTNKVNTKELTESQLTDYINDILKCVSSYDVLGLESIHHELLSNYSIESISTKLISPILIELADNAKRLSSLTSEYSFYRTFLLFRLGGLCLKTSIHNTGSKILLMGVDNEHCEVDMLLFALPLLQQGFEVVTLGCNITIDSIPKSLLSSNAKGLVIYTSLSESDNKISMALNEVINKINNPIFMTYQRPMLQTKSLMESGVIFLPKDTSLQTNIINKNINKTT